MPDELINPFYARETTDLPIDTDSAPDSAALWAVEDQAIGTHIGGRYHVRRIIGSGAMGTVFEAQQQNPRRAVAVKVMRGGVTSPGALRRFTQEAQYLARLRHPCIAEVYDAGFHQSAAGNVPYFVMEYIPNAKRISQYARDHNLSTHERLKLFVNVCDAVEHGHQRGVIHRDLKPGNILVTSEGQPKIIDFGVARATDSDLAATTQQTDVGQVIGTLQYMSPEQYDADPRALDARSDVYSLGVVLYELLCGKLPYPVEKANVIEAARIIREQPPVRPSTITHMVRGDLETIVLQALSKDRDRRYASAAALRDDILHYLKDEPITGRRDSLPYITRKSLQRSLHRRPLEWSILAAIVALLLTHFVAVPLLFTWTPLGHRMDAAMRELAVLPPSAPLEHVRIIAMEESTDFNALAKQVGLDDVAASNDPKRLRALHGKLFERLAQSGAKVVTADIFFPSRSDYDETFVAGVQTLKSAGIPVVVGIKQWKAGSEIESQLNVNMLPHVRWGCIEVLLSPTVWYLPLAVNKNETETLSSLALETVAAYHKTDWQARIQIDKKFETLQLLFWQSHKARPDVRMYSNETMDVQVSAVQPRLTASSAAGGTLLRGDTVASYELVMPGNEVLRQSVVAYEDVFSADNVQLRKWFDNRVVLLGDSRLDRILEHQPTGEKYYGYMAHAVGIDNLLRQTVIWMPTGYEPILIIGLSVALGFLCGWLLGRRLAARLMVTASILLAIFLLCVGAYGVFNYRCNPLVPMIGFVLATEFVAWTQRRQGLRQT